MLQCAALAVFVLALFAWRLTDVTILWVIGTVLVLHEVGHEDRHQGDGDDHHEHRHATATGSTAGTCTKEGGGSHICLLPKSSALRRWMGVCVVKVISLPRSSLKERRIRT